MEVLHRVVPFEGVLNFRDMGGYETVDGRKVKYGLFYRSAELTSMTDRDLEHFQTLNIKTVFDYRDDREAEVKPDPNFPHVEHIRVAAMNQEGFSSDIRELVQTDFFKNMSTESFSAMYVKMAIENPSFQRLMSIIQQPSNLGLLHHCAGGRDRTGIGGAYILLALGVPRETVIKDYLISNETLIPMHTKMKEMLADVVSGEQLMKMQALFELRKEFLEAVFSAIDEKYGDVDTFMAKEFGLTAEKRTQLQSYCLE